MPALARLAGAEQITVTGIDVKGSGESDGAPPIFTIIWLTFQNPLDLGHEHFAVVHNAPGRVCLDYSYYTLIS